jgi:hypothetical protein
MATQNLQSFQSEGGFSVTEATIIDADRNIIDAHTVKVLDNSNNKTFKKEYMTHFTSTDANASGEMLPTHEVEADRIVFLTGFVLATWVGYPVAVFNANANSTTVSCSLPDHALTTGDIVTVDFANNARDSFNGSFAVTVIDNSNFTFDTLSPLDINAPVLQENLEITSYSLNWEFAVKVESAVVSDSSQVLTIAAIANTIVKDNVPPGHTWSVEPSVNNTSKVLTFTPSVASNAGLELRGSGVRWSSKVEIVYSERNY